MKPLDALSAKGRESFTKSGMVRPYEECQEMKFALVILCGDLGPSNHLETSWRRRPRRRNAAECIVIGDSNGRQPATPCELHHLHRTIRAVTVSRVNMQIRPTRAATSSGKLTQCGKGLSLRHGFYVVGSASLRSLSRTPLTNAGDPAEPNRRASSMASS